MFAAVITLAFIANPAPSSDWAGALTAVSGNVVIERESQSLRAVRGSGISNRDRIRVAEDSKAVVYLRGGYVVQLAPSSTASVLRPENALLVVLDKGEVRVASRGKLQIIGPHGQMRLERGIARARYDAGQLCLLMEEGDGTFFSNHGQRFQMQQDTIVTADREGFVETTSPTNNLWSIHAAEYQLASVEQARSLPAIPAALDEIQPSDAPPAATTTPSTTTEDQIRRRRRRTTPRSGAERGSTANTRNTATGATSSQGLGALASTSAGLGSSGGLFSDANQATNQGQLFSDPNTPVSPTTPFPGNIHLVTAQTPYGFDISLNAAEQQSLFPSGPASATYFSIGTGALPTGQVTTDFLTGTNPSPTAIPIPRFDGNYLLRLDQYGIPDPGLNPSGALSSNIGIAGLLGTTPTAPTVTGATPLSDNRAELNTGATFALGEFRITPNGNGISLAIRRSDQDRLIIKDANNNDANDIVITNSQVSSFDDVADPRFQPQAPTVKVPTANAFSSISSQFSNLSTLRRAATTTLVANQLFEFAQRTGQTRFVVTEVDGTQNIIDITGYQGP